MNSASAAHSNHRPSCATVQAAGPARTAENVSRLPLNTPIGNHLLSAWQPVEGTTWVQSRSPEYAQKLSRRSDGRLVLRGVAGGYMRTFEFPHTLAWALRLIRRYTSNGTVTNERFSAPALAPCSIRQRGRLPATARALEGVLP